MEHCESLAPATLLGIERYLGSGLIKGIGPETAKRIVRHFGLKTLEILDHSPRRLTQVEGIGPKRVDLIRAAWEEQKEIRQIMIFLQGQGITTGLATKIFKLYGREAIARLQDNPYALAADLFGVGFLTADRLAEKLGIARDSRQRVEAGIFYFLQGKSEEGHVGFPQSELEQRAAELLAVDLQLVEEALEDLLRRCQLQTLDLPEGGPLILLPYLDHCEAGIAQRIAELKAVPSGLRKELLPEVAVVERALRIHLSERQREALEQALTQKLLVITGGPGTGKTTLIRSILETCKRLELKSVLMAPTGRAAKRLSEVTFHPAATIHRTLRFSPKQGKFLTDRSQPLDAELIIVDEASMIDTVLMYHLLKAVPDRAVLILVGDAYQLPSVGPGQVLSDLIRSRRIPVVELDQIFRQAEGSLIVVNAHRIHQGRCRSSPRKMRPDSRVLLYPAGRTGKGGPLDSGADPEPNPEPLRPGPFSGNPGPDPHVQRGGRRRVPERPAAGRLESRTPGAAARSPDLQGRGQGDAGPQQL